ncbi:MAG: hypothetical protein DYG89_33065 [Caldilinea sp. CFX5]|nr:hypothetical protein [Caldilinea sp. CFX5]
MKNRWFFGRLLTLVLLFSLSMASCIQPMPAASRQALKPGDKIGTMALVQGPPTFDMMAIPPWPAFCNSNPDPTMKPGDTEMKPGVYTVECTMPPLPKFHIGSGFVFADEKLRDADWSAVHEELSVNGHLIDQAAFGSVDADIPSQPPAQSQPAKAASQAPTLKLRVWNVVLENLTPGSLTLHEVLRVDKPFLDLFSSATIVAGVYDLTYKITVSADDQSKAATLTEQEAANQAVIQRFYDEVINQKKFDLFAEIFDPQSVTHDLGMKPDINMLFTAFPDLHVTADQWMLKGDMVTSIATFTGTQEAEFMGVAATHKPVTWSHIDVHRIKDGKIVEVWHNIPFADILQQIQGDATGETAAEAANKAVVQKFYDEVVNKKNLDAFQEVFDPKMTEHALGYGSSPFRDTDLLAGFPDLQLKVDLWLVKGDLVTAVVTASGTQTGEFMGLAPTGKKMTFSQIDIWRVQNGKITDVWHNFASTDILQQVGYQLTPPTK